MRKLLIATTILGVGLAGLMWVAPAQAIEVVPAPRVCSPGTDNRTYACMQAAPISTGAGDTVVFKGRLSPTALRSLSQYTDGDNVVCLTRFRAKPLANGSWPWTTLDAACTTVRRDGGFTINAELGRLGTFFYGLEMGPCKLTDGGCGSSDGGLIGVSNKRDRGLQVTTA